MPLTPRPRTAARIRVLPGAGSPQIAAGPTRRGRGGLTEVIEHGSRPRPRQPPPRRGVSASGLVCRNPGTRRPRRETRFPLPADKRKLLQDRLRSKEAPDDEVTAFRWLAPLLLLPRRRPRHRAQSADRRVAVRRRDRQGEHRLRAQVRRLARQIHGRDVRLRRRLDRLRQRRLRGSVLRQRRAGRRRTRSTTTTRTARSRTSPRRPASPAAARPIATRPASRSATTTTTAISISTSPRFGPNILYRNNGDGTFTDVTATAGVAGGPAEWSTSTGFFDFDRDGDLDLYVTNYLDFRAGRQSRTAGSARTATGCTAIRRCSTAWPTGCSATTATARSPTSRGRPASPIRPARAWASRSATSIATATPTSTSPTTWCATFSTATTATAPSWTSPTAPASGSTPTASRRPAWASTAPTSTATASRTSSSPTSPKS